MKAHKTKTPNRKKPSYGEIAILAYYLYEQAGRPEGKDQEHWFNAESMLENNFGYGTTHREHEFGMAAGET